MRSYVLLCRPGTTGDQESVVRYHYLPLPDALPVRCETTDVYVISDPHDHDFERHSVRRGVEAVNAVRGAPVAPVLFYCSFFFPAVSFSGEKGFGSYVRRLVRRTGRRGGRRGVDSVRRFSLREGRRSGGLFRRPRSRRRLGRTQISATGHRPRQEEGESAERRPSGWRHDIRFINRMQICFVRFDRRNSLPSSRNTSRWDGRHRVAPVVPRTTTIDGRIGRSRWPASRSRRWLPLG